MNDKVADEVKRIFSAYHAGEMLPEQALDELEIALNEN
jgi:hypothetical protein